MCEKPVWRAHRWPFATQGVVQLVVALLAGGALTLAFAPYDLWPLAVLCPALLMFVWRGATPRRAALLGFCFGIGLFTAGTWWLYISIHQFGEAAIWLTLLLVALLVVGMSAYYAGLGFLAARFFGGESAWQRLLAVPALWLLCEWLRGWLFTGFPWLSLGFTQTDTWLRGFAPVVGMYGLSLLLLCVAAAACVLAQRPRSWAVPALILVLPWIAGWALLSVDWTHATSAPVPVAIVQGAIPQDIKWQMTVENRQRTRQLYRDLNEQALGARLILWPESAVTDLAEQIPRYLAGIYQTSRVRDSDVVMGILRLGNDRDSVYNSILALTEPLAFYDKRHLVPYAEYFPVPQWVRHWLERMNLPYSDISRGVDGQRAIAAGGLHLAATICYEDAFANAQRSILREADVLANVTNDAWFGHSQARYQHFQISRMLALQSQRFLLRSANDGVSAVVGPRGEVLQSAPEYQRAVIRGTVTPRRGLTPYATVGDAPVVLVAFCVLLVNLVVRLRRRRAPGHAVGP
jgi:apolipoprotein N-acyltransferase